MGEASFVGFEDVVHVIMTCMRLPYPNRRHTVVCFVAFQPNWQLRSAQFCTSKKFL
jgi:hypothetical protein